MANRKQTFKRVADYVWPSLILLSDFAAGARWPAFRPHVGSAGAVAIGAYVVLRIALLWPEIMKPLNYRSLAVSAEQLVYEERSGEKREVAWSEIVKVRLVREQLWGLQSSWLISKQDGHILEIMDEWIDRRRLLAAFRKHLPGFATREAKRGCRSWKEGSWICFQRPAASALLE
jgi:hypothetical protein